MEPKSKTKPNNKVKPQKINSRHKPSADLKINEMTSDVKEKPKARRSNTRLKKSSVPIEVVDLNNDKSNDQPKKKGWWNN